MNNRFKKIRQLGLFRQIVLFLSAIFLLIILLFPQVIAGDKAIIKKTNSGLHFPVFMNALENTELNQQEESWALYPPIPYSASELQLKEPILAPPFSSGAENNLSHTHWLGTDHLGRDVFSGLIHGFRLAVVVGFGATFIALIIGLILGMLSGYFARYELEVSPFLPPGILAVLILIVWNFYWMFQTQFYTEHIIFLIVCSLCLIGISLFLSVKYPYRITLRVDQFIQATADLFSSVPGLLILLLLLPFYQVSGVWLLILLIGLLRWRTVNRYARAEVIDVIDRPWVTQLRRWNVPQYKILFKYILRAIEAPVLVIAAFSVSSAIIAEATISFLGLGLGVESVSWGAMLSIAREHYDAWWLILFPGLAITISVYFLNFVVRKRIDESYSQEM